LIRKEEKLWCKEQFENFVIKRKNKPQRAQRKPSRSPR